MYQPRELTAARINQSEESGGGQGGMMDSQIEPEDFEGDDQ